jgi:hypothetical protein
MSAHETPPGALNKATALPRCPNSSEATVVPVMADVEEFEMIEHCLEGKGVV